MNSTKLLSLWGKTDSRAEAGSAVFHPAICHMIDVGLVAEKTDFGKPDFSRRLLTPNGRLWDLVLTGKEAEESQSEVMEIEKVLKKWKVVKK